MSGARSTSDNLNKPDLSGFKKSAKGRNQTLSPKERDNKHYDFDAVETATKDSFFDNKHTDYQEDMDENYTRNGSFRASFLNRGKLQEKTHGMSGFFKFLGCCDGR